MTEDTSKKTCMWISFFALVHVVFFSFYGALSGFAPTLQNGFLDPDSYTRLLRVLDLHRTGRWYTPEMEWLNAPFGLLMHWTRPMDMILYAGAHLGSLFTGSFREALNLWGHAVAPTLYFIAIAGWIFAVRPLLPGWGILLSFIPLLSQRGVWERTLISRPDHHCLQIALMIGIISLLIRRFTADGPVRLCAMAGTLMVLFLWISSEALFALLVLLLFFFVLWVKEKKGLRDFVWFTGILAAGTLLALLIERPFENLGMIAYDRLSRPHFFLTALIFLFAAFLPFFKKYGLQETRRQRLFYWLGGGALLTALMGTAFPFFFLGPYGQIHPWIQDVWMPQASETSGTGFPRSWNDVPIQFFLTFPVLWSVPAAVFICRCGKKWRATGLLFLIGCVIFTLTSLYQRRFLPWAHIFYGLSTGVALALLWEKKRYAYPGKFSFPLAAFLTALAISFTPATYDAVLEILYRPNPKGPVYNAPLSAPDWVPRGEVLQHQTPPLEKMYAPLRARYQDRNISALTEYFLSPRLAWFTGIKSMGGPYHRNFRGLYDTWGIFHTRNMQLARTILLKRNIDLVILHSLTSDGFSWVRDTPPGSFYRRLRAGNPPSWLSHVPLPPDTPPYVMIYKVEKMTPISRP